MIWQTLTSFDGRLSRKWFWIGFAAFMLTEYIGVLLIAFIFLRDANSGGFNIDRGKYGFAIVGLLFCWILPVAFTPIWAKRWHDLGQSGARSLIVLIPGIGLLITLVVCGCFRGTDGPSSFGDDPLGGQ